LVERFLVERLAERFLVDRLTDRFLVDRLTDRFFVERLAERFVVLLAVRLADLYTKRICYIQIKKLQKKLNF
jgi:hypothetical protein